MESPRSDPPTSLAAGPAARSRGAGVLCCLAAAVAYTAANTCLRELAAGASAVWTTCVKESFAALVLAPWLLAATLAGRVRWPAPRAIGLLLLVASLTQVGGNLGLQWALGTVGLSTSLPAVFGMLLVSGALLGRIFLREPVTLRTAFAMVVLGAAVVAVGAGASDVHRSLAGDPEADGGLLAALLGVGAAALAGCCYGAMSVTIRGAVCREVPVACVVFLVTGTGLLVLGPVSLWRPGVDAILATGGRDFSLMLAAGAFNFLAFLAITRGFALTDVVTANLINTSQAPLCAIAGVLLFAEPFGWPLVAGCALTVLGTGLIVRRPFAGARSSGVSRS